ncbi:MAG: arsenate reductase ArsC [Sandaracinobacteroides sp.]
MASKAWGRDINILFLCDTNCGRSLMAQAIMEREGAGHFKAFSAGAHPAAQANPVVADILQKLGHETAHLHPRPWSDFARPGSPEMDFIFTMFDEAAREQTPAFGGVPVTSNWSLPTASHVEGNDAIRYAAFEETYREILRRVQVFTNLPFASLDQMSLHAHLDALATGS